MIISLSGYWSFTSQFLETSNALDLIVLFCNINSKYFFRECHLPLNYSNGSCFFITHKLFLHTGIYHFLIVKVIFKLRYKWWIGISQRNMKSSRQSNLGKTINKSEGCEVEWAWHVRNRECITKPERKE